MSLNKRINLGCVLPLAFVTIGGAMLLYNYFYQRTPSDEQEYQDQERKVSRLEERILADTNPSPNNQPDKYAVLIYADDEIRFETDIKKAYRSLIKNGFEKNNIYVFNEDGIGDSYLSVDGVTNFENLDLLFEHLEEKIDNKDILVIEISNHGAISPVMSIDTLEYKDESSIFMPDGNYLTETDFENYLLNIHPKFGLVISDMCYGGGIANRIGGEKYVAISSTTPDKEAFSKIGDSFSWFFFQALEEPRLSDINYDGRTSIEEAYLYAYKNHPWSKDGTITPMIVSDLDPSQLFLDE